MWPTFALDAPLPVRPSQLGVPSSADGRGGEGFFTVTTDSGLLRLRGHLRRQDAGTDARRDSPSGPSDQPPSERPIHDPYAPLARLARDGDREALEQLLRVLAPKCAGAARALFGPDHPDLDDLVQDSLIAVAKAIPAFQGRSTVAHYAYRITVRVCLAGRRRRRRLDEREELVESPDELPMATMPDALVSTRRREAVRALLDTLPNVQAETLALRMCLGMALEEVSEITGAPVNTVRSRLRLARQTLLRRVDADPALKELLGEVQ